MKLYLFPAGRANSVLSLKNYLGIDCEVERLNFTRGDQRKPAYAKLNPNKKMPTLEDDGYVLWNRTPSCSIWRASVPTRSYGPRT
jgi:glutathione S-transferase